MKTILPTTLAVSVLLAASGTQSIAEILNASLAATAVSDAAQHTRLVDREDPLDQFVTPNLRPLTVNGDTAAVSGGISAYSVIDATAYFPSHQFGSMRVMGRGGTSNGLPGEGGSGGIAAEASLTFKFIGDTTGEAAFTYTRTSQDQLVPGEGLISVRTSASLEQFPFGDFVGGTITFAVTESTEYEVTITHHGDSYGGAVPEIDGKHSGYYSWLLPSLTPVDGRRMGDWDLDGLVSGSDFLLWQQNFESTLPNAPGDGNGDGVVDGADLDNWKFHFGDAVPASNFPSAASIPEPNTLLIAIVAASPAVRQSRVKRR